MLPDEVHELVTEEKTGHTHARKHDGSFYCEAILGTVSRLFPSESMSITCPDCYNKVM